MVQESRALWGSSNPQSSFCEAAAPNHYATPLHSTQSPRRREGQNRRNSLMKQNQTLPNVVCLTNGFIMYLQSDQTRGCLSQPNRHSDAVLTLAGDCASDPSVEERGTEEEGGRRKGDGGRGSHQSSTKQQHKSNIMAPTDPSKKIWQSNSIQSSARAAVFPEVRIPLEHQLLPNAHNNSQTKLFMEDLASTWVQNWLQK